MALKNEYKSAGTQRPIGADAAAALALVLGTPIAPIDPKREAKLLQQQRHAMGTTGNQGPGYVH